MAEAQNMSVAPRLECVDRVRTLPVVEMALNQSADMYNRVKGSNSVINWTLSTAEATVNKAMEHAAPLAKKLEQPIQMVDGTLCKGLSLVEERLPIIKEQPQQIYETTKNYVAATLRPTCSKVSTVKDAGVQKAKSLKELSWNKANELLSTKYGLAAVTTVDSTAAVAEKYLDYYFPPGEDEKQAVPVSSKDDKVAHTVSTVGRLSSKLAQRVYSTLVKQVQNLNRENVQEYIASLIAVVQLTNYINAYLKPAEVKTEQEKPESQNVSS
ncbi:lipid storage droplets surface-binding protein 2 [Schistocerca piceifrons]|uniref:lipid storage droplets surface-binding protein 2 n=1 Tax=Schistocerca piceifrons TaxID=274613 RepID=UPI001F5FBE46|nr:lipid storage droplets surface-binding protein 2 [Schistocerca piceifrons]XP_049937969.1 lipid storage droplets surface-binding protein 2 [Schistocerca serialis cubense]